MPSILIVDDLVSIHGMLDAVLQPTGYASAFATDGSKALVRYKNEKFDLVLADIDMKPMDGITLLKQLKDYDPNAVVIIMTAYSSTESAVQALKFGAFDYLQKPFRVDELLATLRRGLDFRRQQLERSAAGFASVNAADIEGRLLGKSAAVTKLVAQVKRLAASRAPLLLVGEKGTGRSLVAQVIHAASGAPDESLVRVDCSLSTEAELRAGLIGQQGEVGTWVRQTRGGTLFLDQLQCLPEPIQMELVGVLRQAAPGFRLIGSTSEDLERWVDEGKFHPELFYRIAALPVVLPPLRERAEDIPLLVKSFAAQAVNPLFDAKLVEFSDEALAILTHYHWPDNIAELRQVVTKIAATTETRMVAAQQIPLRLRDVKSWPSLAEYLSGQEKQYIDLVLRSAHGDKALAAKVLGIEVARLG
jgi:DNA-binding NtrC family response regulator